MMATLSAQPLAAQEASAPQLPETPQVAGGWDEREETSALDGVVTYSALLTSANALANTIGYEDHAELLVRCQGRDLAVLVIWPTYVSLERALVSYRFDAGEVQTEWWPVSTTGTGVGRFRGRQAAALAQQIAQSRQLVIRVFPDYSAPREAVFDLTGGDAVAARALEACA